MSVLISVLFLGFGGALGAYVLSTGITLLVSTVDCILCTCLHHACTIWTVVVECIVRQTRKYVRNYNTESKTHSYAEICDSYTQPFVLELVYNIIFLILYVQQHRVIQVHFVTTLLFLE